jgi:Ca-activated chloride channel family protein
MKLLASLPAEEVHSAARSGLRLFGDYSLADPLFLALLPLALGLLVYGRLRAGRAAGRIPVLPAAALRSLRQRLAWLPVLLKGAALALVIIALARPLRGNEQHDVTSEGVDIALLVDRSGSMRFDDLQKGKTRLDVVKEVVADFAERRMTDREGAADNVALVPFARYPQVLCPFTLDVDAVRGFLAGVELVQHREEDGTAIGVALAKAVAMLRESQAESRVVVLLTDGENNVDEILPRAAAELAAEEGIRVHTIYAARWLYVQDPFRGYVAQDAEADTSDLRAIAELTGGRFWRAKDREQLAGIYAEIEALERTPRVEKRYEETFDLYLRFLLAGMACYGLALLSAYTWARRLA